VKGVDYLARAFATLAAAAPVNLTILGGGPPEETIKAAFPPPVRNLVTVLPRMSEAEVMREYRRHDVLAFPSTYEGFGMVLVEAMSQMLPVVATPYGAAGALVEDGVTGLLVRPRDPDSLAGALRRMLEDRALRERLAAAAYRRVRGMSWRSTALRTIEIYEKAHRRRDPAAVVGRPERGRLDHGGTAGA
jgi:D-inositol-3-phosphate glycosyltransferase